LIKDKENTPCSTFYLAKTARAPFLSD